MAKKRARKTKPDLPFIAEGLRPLAVPVDCVGEDPRNARKHGEANMAAIVASLERFGQLKPAVGNRNTGRLEAGHGMLAAAKRLGWSHLAVVWVEHTEAEARDFGLADNRTAELAEWDQAVLDELVAELREEDDGNDFADAMLLAELESSLAGGDDTDEYEHLITEEGFNKVGTYLTASYGERAGRDTMTKYASRATKAAVPIVLVPRKTAEAAKPRVEPSGSPSKPWSY